jgi:hypothetical protein
MYIEFFEFIPKLYLSKKYFFSRVIFNLFFRLILRKTKTSEWIMINYKLIL